MNNFSSLIILVQELKKQGLEYLWLVSKNMINLVKIALYLMSTSISTEQIFSML